MHKYYARHTTYHFVWVTSGLQPWHTIDVHTYVCTLVALKGLSAIKALQSVHI